MPCRKPVKKLSRLRTAEVRIIPKVVPTVKINYTGSNNTTCCEAEAACWYFTMPTNVSRILAAALSNRFYPASI
jgi:ribosome biogenesis protein Tsr3